MTKTLFLSASSLLLLLALAPSVHSADTGTKKQQKKGEQERAAPTLTWDAPTTNTDGSPLTDLKGYYIYYRHPDEEEYDEDNRITVPVTDKGLKCQKTGNRSPDTARTECTYVVRGLEGGHYFAVSAYGKKNESDLSNEVFKETGKKTDKETDKKADKKEHRP